MGLTIYYQLSVNRKLTEPVVREITQRAADYARRIGCLEVAPLRPPFPNTGADLFVTAGKPEDGCFGHEPPTAGWVVEVWPGEGCESALFGLCQYRRWTPFRGGFVRTGYRQGWLLRGQCKTQYAGEHGWDHFLRCHKQVISLLDFWRTLGVTVKVSDEGQYWETRSVERLQHCLGQNDRLIAAAAGMFKDALHDSPDGCSVQSPIFDYAAFERLEHEGRLEFGEPLTRLSPPRRRPPR